MEDRQKVWNQKRIELIAGDSRVIALVCLAAVLVFCGFRYDFYLDLNDDVLIRDILSGAYTGTPELLNVQMLALLSAVLGGFYRLLPAVPVFGIFLWTAQAGSLYLILSRSLRYVRGVGGKWLLALAETAAIVCMMLEHLVFVQYTITCGLLMAAAIFWFLTSETEGRGIGRFLWGNLPAVLLAFLAYNLRSEMMLMLLPFAALAGLWKWMEERAFFSRRSLGCYLGLFGLILGGMILSEGVDRAAYSGSEWKEFRRVFDARTEIYDFKSAGLREHDNHTAFYDSIGMSPAETELLANYNYGVSEAVDAGLLEAVAEYGRETEGYLLHTIGEGIWLYRERLLNNRELGFDEMPFLAMEIGLAVLLLAAAVLRKSWKLICKLIFLAGGRSVIWMYLILRERVPVRLSHPLYLVEILMLTALLLEVWRDTRQTEGRSSQAAVGRRGSRLLREKRQLETGEMVCMTALIVIVIIAAVKLPEKIGSTDRLYAERERIAAWDEAAKAYYQEHPETLFLADVMSTVQFADRLFAEDRAFGNYDVMGGWLCKSPHAAQKLKTFGHQTMAEAVFGGANVRLVKESTASWDWLIALAEEDGLSAELILTEKIEVPESRMDGLARAEKPNSDADRKDGKDRKPTLEIWEITVAEKPPAEAHHE